MASVEKRGKKYRAIWYDGGGKKQQQSGFTAHSDAMQYALQAEEKARYGHAIADRRMLWGQWCDRWLESRRVEATTEDSDLPRIRKYLRPKWGETPLIAITSSEVKAWVKHLERKEHVAPASLAKIYGLFNNSMRAAVDDRILDVSPCVGIKLPPVDKNSGRALTREEVWKVVALLAEPYATAVVILAYTGIRFSELAGLHWSNVLESEKRIMVAETWTAAGGVIKAYPKDELWRKTVLPPQVMRRIQRPDNWQKPCGQRHAYGNKCTGQLVLTGPNGAPLNARNMLRRHWKPALALAGLPDCRQHDLRHAFATWMIERGVPIADVADMLGHSTTYVTERYKHLTDDSGDRVLGVLNSFDEDDLL